MRRLRRIETETDLERMVGGVAHRVKSFSGDLVRRQVINGIAPEHEAGSPFGEHYLYASFVSGTGLAHVQDNDGNAGEFELPVGVYHCFRVEIRQGSADEDLRQNNFC